MRIKLSITLSAIAAVALSATAQAAVNVHPATARVAGEVERITVKDPTDVWSEATMVVAGQNVTVPRNVLADLPANRLTMQQVLANAPAGCLARGETGLAKADACNTGGAGAIATIEANRTPAGNVIAGDVFLQKGAEIISGTVSFIDFADGYFRINGIPGDAATGVMVRLNDPSARYSTQKGRGCAAGSENCSPDARYTGDPDNYTQTYSTGYPLCIPSTEPRTFTDTLDVNGNGNRAETLTSQAAANGTGDVLCPASNRTSLVAADSRRFAPLQLDDDVTVQGNFETVGGVRFLSAWSTMIGRALTTNGAAGQPDYMMLNEMSMDAAGFDLNRARSLFIGSTTAPTSDVVIWSLHRDTATNAAHEFPLATVRGCEAVKPGCQNVLGPNTFRVRFDVDFRANRKPDLSPCAHLRADPRFSSKNICPNGGTIAEQFAILSPLPREVQARTGLKMADLARAGGPVLKTIDVKGDDAPNGQYLFPMGVGLGGIEIPLAAEFNIDALGLPTIFDGLPWALDRRLSPNGCDGPCEATPQPMDPFPFSGRDPRTQAVLPTGAYSDPNYTHSQIADVRDRILSFILPSLSEFDGNHSIFGGLAANPAAAPIGQTPLLADGAADKVAPSMPTGLTAAGVASRQIDLDWTASTDNVGVTNYLVLRDGDPTPVAIVAGTSTTLADTGLTAGSTHSYRVQAIDAAGNTSEKSQSAEATASAPKVKLTRTSVTFDEQATGSTSAAQTITLENSGDATLTITSAAISGSDAGQFAEGANGCTGATVAVGSSCTMEVRFAPTSAGTKQARLAIRDNVPGSSHAVALHGAAAAAAPRAEAPAAAPAAPVAPAAPAAPPLRQPLGLQVTALSLPAAVSAKTTSPIRMAATVPAGAKVLEIRVFRLGAGDARTLIGTVVQPTPAAKRYRLRLTGPKLRHPVAGRYVLEVRAGSSRTDLGPAAMGRITVR
jgi:hypothetical protein